MKAVLVLTVCGRVVCLSFLLASLVILISLLPAAWRAGREGSRCMAYAAATENESAQIVYSAESGKVFVAGDPPKPLCCERSFDCVQGWEEWETTELSPFMARCSLVYPRTFARHSWLPWYPILDIIRNVDLQFDYLVARHLDGRCAVRWTCDHVDEDFFHGWSQTAAWLGIVAKTVRWFWVLAFFSAVSDPTIAGILGVGTFAYVAIAGILGVGTFAYVANAIIQNRFCRGRSEVPSSSSAEQRL